MYRDINMSPVLPGIFSIFYILQPYDNSDKNINFVTPEVGKAAETPQKLVGKAAEIPQKNGWKSGRNDEGNKQYDTLI